MLKDVRSDDPAALAIRAPVERTGIEPGAVEDVILGRVNQAGEDNPNVARMARLLAGLPLEVAGRRIVSTAVAGVDPACMGVGLGIATIVERV